MRDAIGAGFSDIILVDDGSHSENKKYFAELAALPEVTVLTHGVNLGKGAALKTAFSYFMRERPNGTGVITADGDGQHRTADIVACAEAMQAAKTAGEPAVVLGCRDFSLPHVPKKSRFGNKTTSLVFRLFCGMKISDTQTGLRAFPREYIPEMLEVKGTRYEYETNMLLMMGSADIPYKEVKIDTVYYDNNEKSHFRPVRDSIRVYGLIIKYAASSVASSVVDLLAFYLLARFLFGSNELAATALARAVSVIFNFTLNKKLVFENGGKVGKTLLRYICLAVPIMLASGLALHFISNVLMVESAFVKTLIKLPVDTLLFLISFRVQKKWVFN